MANNTILKNGVGVNDSDRIEVRAFGLTDEQEEWRLRVEAALNEARDLRRAGDRRADKRGQEAMREYTAFLKTVGQRRVNILVPDVEPAPARMTAKRQTALRDSRRLFRMTRRTAGLAPPPVPA